MRFSHAVAFASVMVSAAALSAQALGSFEAPTNRPLRLAADPSSAHAPGFRFGGVILNPPSVEFGAHGGAAAIELYNASRASISVEVTAVSAKLQLQSNCPVRLPARRRCVLTAHAGPQSTTGIDTAFLLKAAGETLAVPLIANAPLDFTRPSRPPRDLIGRSFLKNAGLYTQIERRGWASTYWTGELIQNWDQFDSLVNSTVSQETSLQLDKMRAMGVNTITLELRSADATTATFAPPSCNINPVLGVRWPQPTATELANLPKLFDMVQSKGMKVWLRLVNTHMEELPPSNSTTWLGSIFGAIKNHPALDLVLFEGDAHLTISRDNGPLDTCGGQAEPPLYLGPNNIASNYISWAIGYGMSQGIPARKLSAEAIVGSFFVESGTGAGSNATDRHQWSPIKVLKGIFDGLAIPAEQRTYAISFYEQQKCSSAGPLTCVDESPHAWAEDTLIFVRSVIGDNNGARIVAPEMGNLPPVSSSWPENHALESLVFLMNKYNVDGGTFWRWTSFENREDSDTTLAKAVKIRGTAFVYNTVKQEVVDMGGFHLFTIPNGSFESVTAGVPDNWSISQTASSTGSGASYSLTQESGQPEVASRGTLALELTTGSETMAGIAAVSTIIPATRNVTYTTSANLRFNFSGDQNPAADPTLRPNVYLKVKYFQSNGSPSSRNPATTFRLFQENSTTGFATFPFVYTLPADAAFVQLIFGAERNGLPSPIRLDVDNLR